MRDAAEVIPPVQTKTATQTSTEEKPKTGSDEDTSTDGDDVDETGKSGEDQTVLKPDTEGKYDHPETKAKVDAQEMIEYYAGKFSASSSGAQGLLDKNKNLSTDLEGVRAELETSKKDMDALRKVAEGKNPEGLSLLDLQKNLESTTKSLALEKEERLLDQFVGSVKVEGASSYKEALRALARSQPSVPLQTLWDSNLKAGAEAAAAKTKARKTSTTRGASEQGKGTSTREQAKNTVGNTGLALEEFNALPVAKRRELLAKS